VASLSRDLGILSRDQAEKPQIPISPGNAYGKELYSKIESYEDFSKPIASFHFHPTNNHLNWMKSWGGKAVVLLRDPKSSFESLSRHREVDNSFKQPNLAYKSKNLDGMAVLLEFNRNWRTLREYNNLLFLSYDEVVGDYPKVFERICEFYDYHSSSIDEIQPLEKVRFSGHRSEKEVITDLSKIDTPTFDYDPDFTWLVFFARKSNSSLPIKWFWSLLLIGALGYRKMMSFL